MNSLYDFSALSIRGETVSLRQYSNQVLLIVNVASECGFTKQYAGLQALYEKYHDQGFSVLGFPCNQFGSQEPGNAKQIMQFCQEQYKVQFPMFDKITVNGPHALPLFTWLKSQKSGLLGSSRIKWNFTKFLINRDGQVLKRFSPTTRPQALASAIKAALAAKSTVFRSNDS